jgi:hypothetical protein
MKNVLKKLLVVVALPISMVVVLWLFLRGCQETMVCDPVHPGKMDPNNRDKPSTRATQPDQPRPPVCDPVHVPPPPPDARNVP